MSQLTNAADKALYGEVITRAGARPRPRQRTQKEQDQQ